MSEHDAPSLEISLFGPFEARLHGAPLPRLRTRKDGWLLSLLTLRAGRPQPLGPVAGLGTPMERGWLAGTLWPDSDEAAALVNLRSSLKELRRALGTEAGRLRSPTRHTVCLDLTGAAVDLFAFDAAVAGEEGAALERAVALYRGPLLEGCLEEWVIPEREAREYALLRALERLATRAREREDWATAERYLRQTLAIDPLRETAQQALMEALAASGNVAAATLTYRDLRLRLHRELNTEPSPETTALYQQLRTAGWRGGRERGSEGARERGSASEKATPSLALSLPRASHLPQPLTPLIGRDREIREITDLLGEHRLVTLTGTGGVGKTRLATQVALDLAAGYPEGVWFVELAATSSAALLPQVVVSALEVSPRPGRSPLETLIDYLGDRRSLLVLDNCEHLVGACAHLGTALLRGAPELRILATSRQRLGLTGEIVYPTPSLAAEDAVRLFRARAAAVTGQAPPAPQYWGERATHDTSAVSAPSCAPHAPPSIGGPGGPDPLPSAPSPSAPAEHSPSVVGEICRRLDNVPLAIELAAARLSVLTLEEIAARLDDRFRLLTLGSRTALPRHQTLRALLDWSYELLAEPERVLLRQLSVFAGGWTLAAAEAVCSGVQVFRCSGVQGTNDQRPTIQVPGSQHLNTRTPEHPNTDEVLDLLTSLVDQSLVLAEPGPAGMRYRLLETVRQYGGEKLQAAGNEASVRTRHRDWYLDLAERAHAASTGPEQVAWLDRLAAEQDNLRAALEWSLGRGAEGDPPGARRQSHPEPGLRLGAALWWFWDIRGSRLEGREWLGRLLARPGRDAPARPSGDDPALRTWIELSHGAGCLARGMGDLPASGVHHEASLVGARELGEPNVIAWSLLYLGWQRHEQSEFAVARTLYQEALGLMRASQDRRGIAMTLNQLGSIVARFDGSHARAREFHEEALVIGRSTGNLGVIADSLHFLGRLARWQEELDLARSLYEEAWEIRETLGDRGKGAKLLLSLGDLAFEQHDATSANHFYARGQEIFQALGDRLGAAHAAQGLGRGKTELGDFSGARAVLERTLKFYQEAGSIVAAGLVVASLGRLALAQQDPVGAGALFAESEALIRAEPSLPNHWLMQFDWGEVALHLGDAPRAAACYEETLAIGRSRAHGRTISRALHGLGWAAHASQQPELAACRFAEALAIRKALGDQRGMTLCLDGLAAAACLQGRFQEAARLLGTAEAMRQSLGAVVFPVWQPFRDRTQAAVRAQMSEPEFTAAWAEGKVEGNAK